MPRTFLLMLILSLLACCIEIDISVPSFPDMAAYFVVSEGMIQLTIAYNFLGFCLASICYGPLSESYGRRRVMIAGNALLLLGAAGCVFAPTMGWLLCARFIQGIGAATPAVIVFAMIADAYQGEKAVKLIGIMNSILTTVMAVAPVAGGFINKAVGWRGNYGIVAIVCLISWVFLFLLLPETKKHLENFSLTKALKDYKQLLSSRRFLSASIAPSLLYTAYLSFIACGSFLYMETFGLSIIAYALHQGFIVSTFSLISLFSGKLIEKLGTKGCIIKGLALSALGAVLLVILSFVSPNSPYLMTSFMSLFCIGAAMAYPVIFMASLEIFPHIKGVASSTIMAIRALLIFISMSLTSYLYNGHPFRVAVMVMGTFILVFVLTLHFLKHDHLPKKALMAA